jgi:DNA polymerase-1
MERLVLIDGNALVHRAYHAYPPLTDPDNNPVGALYGFFSMLLKIMQDMKPHNVVVCFDCAAPTFRQELYVAYHEHRPQLSEDFVPQLIAIQELLQAAGVCVFAVSGYEADDLIGTIAHQAIQNQESSRSPELGSRVIKNQEKNIEVIIVTGDRDLLQLINPHVRVIMPITGITNMKLFGEAEVKEKYGVLPSQFVDYKALIGDPSDGYPGVTGIGPKTAATLISEFGSFENLYKHLGEVVPKTAEKLALDAEQASLAKKLATIVTDAPIHLDMHACNVKNMKKEVLVAEFRKRGFKSLTSRWNSAEQNSEKGTKESKTSKKKKGNASEQLGLI